MLHLMTTALITGITGQDGSYLAELLLEKNYDVHGMVRRASTFNRGRIDHLSVADKQSGSESEMLHLHYGDLSDPASLSHLVSQIKPDEIYHLGAQSHVQISFAKPQYTAQITALGTLNLLEAVRQSGLNCRIYQAGSSEMFGKVREVPQTENTPFYPRSPYGVSKVFAHWMAVNYRETYNMFICNGILFNHESPRRGENFVTRKISRGAAAIKLGLQKNLHLGNLEAKRDWGHAKDYVEAMWLMLQQKVPDDYVIATGEMHSVREFCHLAFEYVGLDYRKYVVVDPKHIRPSEVDILLGDASKAQRELKWTSKTSFVELVTSMVDADLKMLEATGSLAG